MSAEPTTRTRYTPEAFLELDDAGYELVDGELEERNVSYRSSIVAGRIIVRVGTFVEEHGLGDIIPPDLGLQIFPNPRRIPRADVAFVAAARVTADVAASGFLRIPPDLVVEVVSRGDNAIDLQAKVDEYLSAGVRLVWVVYPEARKVYVYRLDGTVTPIGPKGVISGEDVIPGFDCHVAEFFPSAAEAAEAAEAAAE